MDYRVLQIIDIGFIFLQMIGLEKPGNRLPQSLLQRKSGLISGQPDELRVVAPEPENLRSLRPKSLPVRLLQWYTLCDAPLAVSAVNAPAPALLL